MNGRSFTERDGRSTRRLDSPRAVRESATVGCDTLVALAPATEGGRTIFAKNSDRPPREAQGVVQQPRRRHAEGARRRCQYLEIPEVPETNAFVGARPYWLSGLEHGVNEHRVAIGNEMLFTREPLGAVGLLGMDLVRLGLERAGTAAEAVEVITSLVETHGQGGSGQPHMDWPYSSSFIVADPVDAWILETAGRQWAARRVRGVDNVSNGLAIGTEWDRAARDARSHAVRRGWWPAAGGRLDFAAAYADPSVPAMVACPRRERAAALLGAAEGRIDVATMRAILRDHHDLGPLHRPRPEGDPNFFTLCMHADPLDNTTASMIATLAEDPDEWHAIWVSLGSPCVGGFVPVYLEGEVPTVLGRVSAEEDPASPWWTMRTLLTLVEQDPDGRGPIARGRWDEWEAGAAERAGRVEAAARDRQARGDLDGARALVGRATAEAVSDYLDVAGRLVRELGG
jgi:secernin